MLSGNGPRFSQIISMAITVAYKQDLSSVPMELFPMEVIQSKSCCMFSTASRHCLTIILLFRFASDSVFVILILYLSNSIKIITNTETVLCCLAFCTFHGKAGDAIILIKKIRLSGSLKQDRAIILCTLAVGAVGHPGGETINCTPTLISTCDHFFSFKLSSSESVKG